MDLLAAERGGAVAEDSRITPDAWQDIHVAWDLFRPKDVQGSTSVVANLKTKVWVVKKSAKSALLHGELPATNALSNLTIWSKSIKRSDSVDLVTAVIGIASLDVACKKVKNSIR